MASRRTLPGLLGGAMVLAGHTVLQAQTSLWLASVNYESPVLAAPVILYVVPSDDLGHLRFGVLGWTLSGGWAKTFSPDLTSDVSVDLTPVNSHSSNLVYRDGGADEALEYRNASLQVRAGLTIHHSIPWSSELAVLGSYERVDGLDDEAVLSLWRRPYVGVEVGQSYRTTISNDILRSRSDGFALSGRLQIYAGTTTWWRSTILLDFGKKYGRLFLRGSWSYLAGNSLNTVSRFLVGGSWDVPGINTLYGYRYGEFRMNQCLLLNGAVDVRLFEHWDVGVRAGYMSGPTLTRYGEKICVGRVWNGIGLNVGAGFPEDSAFRGDWTRVVVVAGLTFALFEPW